MESLEEYRKKIMRVHDPREHEIKGSYGVLDAYRFYMKLCNAKKEPYLTSTQYYKIIRLTNKLLGEYIVDGEIIKLPCRMGEILVGRYTGGPRIDKDGNLKIGYAVDWNRTLELWHEDEEAERDKILLRHEIKEKAKVYLSKRSARFENQTYYKFKLVRILNNQIKNKLKEGTMSGFLFKRPNYG